MLKFKLPEKKFNAESTILTLVACSAIVLILLTSTIYPPDPPLDEELPEVVLDEPPPVSLGMPDEGRYDRDYTGPSGGDPQANDDPSDPKDPGEDLITNDNGEETDLKKGDDAKTDGPKVKAPSRNRGTFKGFGDNVGVGDKDGAKGDPLGDPNGDKNGVLGGTGPFKNTLGRNPKGKIEQCAFDQELSVVLRVRVDANGKATVLGIDKNHRLNKATAKSNQECAERMVERLDWGKGEPGEGIVVVPFKRTG